MLEEKGKEKGLTREHPFVAFVLIERVGHNGVLLEEASSTTGCNGGTRLIALVFFCHGEFSI